MNGTRRTCAIKKCCISILLIVLLKSNLSAQDNQYEIFALRFASGGMAPVNRIAIGSESKDSVEVCFMYWLLKGNKGRTVLVDAGFSDSTGMGILTYEQPDKILEQINIRPEDITDIILTHPHWDHIGGIDLFPNARIWMQKEDYDYFVGAAWQKDGTSVGFNKKDVLKIVQKNLEGKLTLVKGDDLEIMPGIRVFTGSKHTFETQYVLVDSHSDKVIIASDNTWFYYNLENLLPISLTFDSKAYVQNLKRMKTMVRNTDLIIPGHDTLVFSKFPMVAKDVAKIRD